MLFRSVNRTEVTGANRTEITGANRTTIIGGSHRYVVWDDVNPAQRLSIYERGVDVSTFRAPDDQREMMVQYRTGDMMAPALGEHEALGEVARRTGVPVAADESARSAAEVAALARSGAAQVVNVKITKSGLAEALDMVAAARAAGLGLMVGGMVETPLAMATSACLAAGVGGFGFVDLDTPLFMRDLPTEGGWAYAGPDMRVDPQAKGHGVTVREPPRP